MKRMMKYVGVLLAGALMLTACSEDYLETSSSNSLSDDVLSTDVSYYENYINGLSLLMVYQQGNYGQGYCGMCDILTDIGDSCGNDWSGETYGGFNSANMKLMTANNAAYAGYAWWPKHYQTKSPAPLKYGLRQRLLLFPHAAAIFPPHRSVPYRKTRKYN